MSSKINLPATFFQLLNNVCLDLSQRRGWERKKGVIGEHRGQPHTKINTVSQFFILLTCNVQNYTIKVAPMCQSISHIFLFLCADIPVQIDNIFSAFEQRCVTCTLRSNNTIRCHWPANTATACSWEKRTLGTRGVVRCSCPVRLRLDNLYIPHLIYPKISIINERGPH